MNKKEKQIILFTGIAHFLSHFYILVFPPVAMFLSREFSQPLGEILSISFPMYLCYGLLAIPWGIISDKYGYRLVMGLGILIAALGILFSGLSSSLKSIEFFLALTGIGCSAYHPSGVALLSKGVKKRGKAFGINGLLGNIGIASAPIITGILSYFFGWKTALIILGGVGAVFGFLIFLFPINVDRYTEVQKGTIVDKKDAKRVFILFLISLVFSGLMYRGFTIILPSFFEKALPGFSKNLLEFFTGPMEFTPDKKTLLSTIIASVIYLAGIIGQLLGGKIADSKDLRWSYFFFWLATFPFLLLLGIGSGPMIILFALAFSFFDFGLQPVENSFIAMVTPTHWRSLSYGLKFTMVFGIGAISVKIAGYIEKLYGVSVVMLTLLVPLIIAIGFVGLILFLTRGAAIRHHH